MGRLFGTDGVRGVANQDLTPELAFGLGRAAAAVLTGGPGRSKVLIGRDTRISGPMLEAALIAGFTSAGAEAVRLGIVPTPGVAYLARAMGAGAAAMISASHNPVPDNGIKFFAGDGYKLPDATEDEIERILREESETLPRPTGTGIGMVEEAPGAWRIYADYLKTTCPEGLHGLRLVIDCGFGASYQTAPAVLAELGAEVCAINAQADGARINVQCGSTHPEGLRREVVTQKAQAGLAFDGDADRIIAVDERGEIVDGDHIMAICALARLAKNDLPQRALAATVYSNLGLLETMRSAGGEVVVTPNGDRYVLEAMRREGLALGGEQSGHIIFLEHNTTGDGLLTGLQLLRVLGAAGKSLSVLAGQMRTFPQVLRNVAVARKEELDGNDAIRQAVAKAEGELAGRGRIFVRASGTEKLVRVMAEGPEESELQGLVAEVARVIEAELG